MGDPAAGPWIVSGVRYKWREAHNDTLLDGHLVGPDGDPVCLVFYGGDDQHAEQWANAKLIARAPDMAARIEALEAALSRYIECANGWRIPKVRDDERALLSDSEAPKKENKNDGTP